MFQVNIGRRAMGALSVRYETQYVTGNIAEVICKSVLQNGIDSEFGMLLMSY